MVVDEFTRLRTQRQATLVAEVNPREIKAAVTTLLTDIQGGIEYFIPPCRYRIIYISRIRSLVRVNNLPRGKKRDRVARNETA